MLNWSNLFQKVLGKAWPDEAYDHMREAFGKDGKYTQYFNRIAATVDQEYLKKLFMSMVYEGAICGYRNTQKMGKKLGVKIPWTFCLIQRVPATCTAQDAGHPSTADS
jgi:hypothetical protein